MKVATTRRPYRMGARAASAAATGERILDAMEERFWDRPLEQVSLDDVARGAGVSVQTVLRRFGSKDGLVTACADRAMSRVSAQRDQAPVGDVAGAVANLMDHYEEMGGNALRLLAEEDSGPTMRAFTERGRRYHQDWVARTFAPQLAGLRGAARKRRLAQLISITDVYTWKILRRDTGLSRSQTERALRELIDGLGEPNAAQRAEPAACANRT